MERMIGNPLEIDPPSAEWLAARERGWQQLAQLDGGYIDGPLHVLVGERQTGKTRLAMRWLNEAPDGVTRVLVMANETLARHHRIEQGFPANDERIISWRRLQRRLKDGRHPEAGRKVEYGIDDAATILQEMLGLRSVPALVTVVTAFPWQDRTD